MVVMRYGNSPSVRLLFQSGQIGMALKIHLDRKSIKTRRVMAQRVVVVVETAVAAVEAVVVVAAEVVAVVGAVDRPKI